MKTNHIALILAVLLLTFSLCACSSNSVWGNERLLVPSKAEGTVFSYTAEDGTFHFSLTAPSSFRSITETDETAAMILTDDTLTVRVDEAEAVLNLATTTAETTTAAYKELGITFVSYTRGQVLGANGIKAVGNYEENGTAMQQCQYSLNENGHCYVLTAYYPQDQARALKSEIASILGSFTTQQAQ